MTCDNDGHIFNMASDNVSSQLATGASDQIRALIFNLLSQELHVHYAWPKSCQLSQCDYQDESHEVKLCTCLPSSMAEASYQMRTLVFCVFVTGFSCALCLIQNHISYLNVI